MIFHGAVVFGRTAVFHAGPAHLRTEFAHAAAKITAATEVAHPAAEIAATAKTSTETAAEVAATAEAAAAPRHGVGCKTKSGERNACGERENGAANHGSFL